MKNMFSTRAWGQGEIKCPLCDPTVTELIPPFSGFCLMNISAYINLKLRFLGKKSEFLPDCLPD